MYQPKVADVKPLANYKLFLIFDTSEKRIFDVTPYIKGNWYGKLEDVSYFNTVHICGDTVEWAGGQDLAPHELYDNSILVD